MSALPHVTANSFEIPILLTEFWTIRISLENFEDTIGVIRSHETKNDRQYNIYTNCEPKNDRQYNIYTNYEPKNDRQYNIYTP
jgi:hypothetical protein